MERLEGIASLPVATGPTVSTAGFFDGVHLGHRVVLGRTVAVAGQLGIPSVAVTFDRHPREVLTPGKEPRLLTTVDRKASLIAATGIDVLVVLEFTEGFSRWPPDDFIQRVLVDGVHARHVVIGADFTFGHRAAGTVDVLIEAGPRFGFGAERVELLELDGRRVSSSSIREALYGGYLDWPLRALGRRYVVDGRVVPGAGRGAGLGWPTANLRTWPRLLLPGRGIYAGRASVDGVDRVAAIDVGTNPTFGTEPLHVEAYLLDFQGDLVGQQMAVEFWARLRDEERFDTPDELAQAISDDVSRTRELIPPPGG